MGNKEILIGNSETSEIPMQAYPGQYLPVIELGDCYPDPAHVGKYFSRKEFLNTPKWPSSWVHWTNLCENILNGEYEKIVPVHFEGIYTLCCSFLCPHCTRKKDRINNGAWRSPGNNISLIEDICNDNNTMPPCKTKLIIDQLVDIKADNQMGIVWGGGDPTMNPFTYEGIYYSRSKGVSSSFITNGALLNVERLFWAEPTLVRISLNCGDSTVFNSFHGLDPKWGYYEKTLSNLEEINRKKVTDSIDMLFGISLILDERNLCDFENTIHYLTNLIKRDGKGIDYLIIRPVMRYPHLSEKDVSLETNTKSKANLCFDDGAEAAGMLKEVDLPIVPIKDSFCEPLPSDYYKDKKNCLAYGVCGEIRFNGDVQLCSDSYGNPEYTIGNIQRKSLEEILKGRKRQEVLAKINETMCFKERCPHNSRGHHLNRMFYQVEQLRREDNIGLARKWIQDMRLATYPIGHSFFL